MDVHKVYGVDASQPAADDETADDETADGAPNPADAPVDDAAQQSKAAPAQQLGNPSATANAAAAIDRLLSGAPKPISSALVTANSDHGSAGESAEPTKRSGLLPSLLGERLSRLIGATQTRGGTAGQSDDVDGRGVEPADGNAEEAAAEPGAESPPLLRPKHLILGGVAVVVVLVIAVVIGAAHGRETEPVIGSQADSDTTQHAPTKGGPSQRDKPLRVEISTTKPPRCPAPSTDAANAISGDPTKAWTCTRAYNADGATLNLTLPGGPYCITSVRLVPGWDYTGPDKVDQWLQYRIVSAGVWRFDDGKRAEQKFDGSRKQQHVDIDCALSSTVQLQITKTSLAAPVAPTTSNAAPLPGLPGGWGSINLPEPSGIGAPSGAQNSGEPSAFAVSSLEIIGHRAQ
ncbi:hypothetical protein [Mycobacterium talmoniae]|uniref:hypothetical protein n=1 Tax=Mycobacterium talmoniae TaxID=1858794 RepID=UPI000AF79262|nr:hypothetical protein [Mycobacterium talmoniae]